jgi:Na+-transporting methylmalonyl-CoA/oxaloacetate decarboxylase gamma subunit
MLYGQIAAALLLAPLLVPGLTMRHLMLIILGLSVVVYLLVLLLVLVRFMGSRTRQARSGRTIRR